MVGKKPEALSDEEDDGLCDVCHAHMDVKWGDDPTDICHSCAYVELDHLRAENARLTSNNAALTELVAKSGETIARLRDCLTCIVPQFKMHDVQLSTALRMMIREALKESK
jgi:hypothetical protein